MQTNAGRLRDFAARYTAAWCSQEPARVAAFFSPGGSLTINDGAPATGREAITEAARSFMMELPDLQVVMDDLVVRGDVVEYHWTLSGRGVRISGFEEWRWDQDGLIASSQGHFDAADYRRQFAERH